jgi:uncharacterized PurR-regulated membrane protein YhhQ (DUF165 family)
MFFQDSVVFSLSKFLFPLIFILICLISYIFGKKTTIFVIIIGLICEILFAMSLFYASFSPVPGNMTNNEIEIIKSVDIIGKSVSVVYFYKLVPTFLVDILGLALFEYFFRKKNNLFIVLSTVSSIMIILYNIFELIRHQNQQLFIGAVTIEMIINIIYCLILVKALEFVEITNNP